MDEDEIWRTIDEQRASLADLLDELDPVEWEAASLCKGWRVRDVAAHLTMAHMTLGAATVNLTRAAGSFDRMVRDSAIRRARRLPVGDLPPLLRALVGSRRKFALVSDLEPLLDVLVHGQDIAIPLGRPRAMPVEAAAVAATRVWTMGWPFWARRRLRGIAFTASDVDWSAGQGRQVQGPMVAILLLLTGRTTALEQLSGTGVDDLQARAVRSAS